MSPAPPPDREGHDGRPAVLIVGGGVAGLEAALALRAGGYGRVAVELLAPDERFIYRPFSVVEAFGGGRTWSHDLAALVADAGAAYRRDALRAVDRDRRRVLTEGGADLPYDALLLTIGSRRVPAIPGAVTFAGPEDVGPLREVLADLESGAAESVVFAVPPGLAWPLPLYELALMTRTYLRRRGVEPRIDIVTPESQPVGHFGAQPSADMRALLDEYDIGFRTGYPCRFGGGMLQLVPEDSVPADRVVALAAHEGPRIEGVPADPRGFLPVDRHCAVQGAPDVWAAGDATDFPIKQGGVAAQQADAAVSAILHRFGVIEEPTPFRPVLRGILVGADRPQHLRGEPTGGRGDPPAASATALWWPPAKVAGRHLAPFLAAHGAPALPHEPEEDGP